MCGICGIAYPDPQRSPPPGVLEAMTDSLAHRGPDASGTCGASGVFLGHRRLSVIDLDTGRQPMELKLRGLHLVFNGEIYNFPTLRDELIATGAIFQTRSDTEVILHGYVAWGMERLLERLAGMFAFALWDEHRRSLYLVRDRLGVKPLFWTADERGTLYFASEMRAFRALPDPPAALNRRVALQYFSTGYVMGEDAILRGVKRVSPGSFLQWSPGERVAERRYWDLAAIWSNARSPKKSDSEYRETFSALLDRCVSERLLSDVPLGAFLSGGLDSSMICARIRALRPELKTFSMGFQEESYSELPWASLVAKELGTEHTEAVVRCESPELLLEVARHLDEPFADTSILPTWVLCREARKHLTVALSGDGGDELLAGYTTHAADRLRRLASIIPGPLLAAASLAANQLPDDRRKVGATYKLKQFLSGARLTPCDAHAWWRMLLSRDALQGLIAPDAWDDTFNPFAPFQRAWDDVPTLSPLDRMLYVDYKTWLADDILVKVDRASMAHGLEVRSPFLDHRLVEFCAGLPAHLKLSGVRGKKILREVAKGQVPAGVIARKKAGFNAPVSHWIAGPWRELVHDTLRAKDAGVGMFNQGNIKKLLDDHTAGKRDHGFLIFTLLMFALWARRD
jgi:asparagine synthase (glutamine-hydrolysing)